MMLYLFIFINRFSSTSKDQSNVDTVYSVQCTLANTLLAWHNNDRARIDIVICEKLSCRIKSHQPNLRHYHVCFPLQFTFCEYITFSIFIDFTWWKIIHFKIWECKVPLIVCRLWCALVLWSFHCCALRLLIWKSQMCSDRTACDCTTSILLESWPLYLSHYCSNLRSAWIYFYFFVQLRWLYGKHVFFLE